MSSKVAERFLEVFINLFSLVEPFVSQFISLYLVRQLDRWRGQGVISDYRRRVRRLGRFHYEVSVDLELDQKQLNMILRRVAGKKKVRGGERIV